MDGWIKVYRCITQNFLWNDKPFSRGQAWIDMLLMANHEPHKLRTKTQVIDIDRGSFHTETRSLMARWGWSNTKVANFLTLLISEKMIEITVQKSATGKAAEGTTIKVLNYCIYQGSDESEKDAKKDAKKTHTRRTPDAQATKQEVYIPTVYIQEERKNTIGVFEQALKDFTEMRVKLKKPLTDRALELVFSNLSKMASTDEEKAAILNQSIVNGWTGIYPLKKGDAYDGGREKVRSGNGGNKPGSSNVPDNFWT